ncbi:hypothetical protein UA08_05858 [Talaromyces atroroseus]|uniref:Fungal N-terminal domain-containing protein n=1 Tax=Talaromyces atroroseus TaxID=1441469 RepID=A0A225ATA7_TALAT|nr:hypothetical protein UA08_05858 [Talaromyces atroroseus]OKL58829.1 hypothetical protein UA08_05858 [Talaromyces atroroseus]
MDPVTAIGLLSNIIGFIDLGWNLFRDAREVYKSASGLTESALAHKLMAERMEKFSNNLITSNKVLLTSKEDKVIVELACNCRKLAQEIIHHLDKTKPQDSKSLLYAVSSSFRTVVHYKKRKELREQLAECQQQLHLHLVKTTRSLTALKTTSESNDKRMAQLQDHVRALRQMVDESSFPDALFKLRNLLNISEDTYNTMLSHKVVSTLKTLKFGDMNTRFDSVPQALMGTYQ